MNTFVVSALITRISHDGRTQVLLVRKGEFWILPGGKRLLGEIDRVCLQRELSEELPQLNWKWVTYLASYSGVSPLSQQPIRVSVHRGKYAGGDIGINPKDTIEASGWFFSVKGVRLSDVTRDILSHYFKE